jgi:hypothetical protein
MKYTRAAWNNQQPAFYLQHEGKQPLLEKPLTANEVDVQKSWLTDTVRFLHGVYIKPQTIKLFKIGLGQQASYANVPSINYTKHKGDTTMESGNFLSGQAFDMANIQVAFSRRFFQLSADEEAIRANAASNNPPGVLNIVNEIDVCQHLSETATITTKYGGSDKARESGLLKYFPTNYGMLISTGGTSYLKANNGFGRAFPLLAVRRIGDKQNIDVEIEILEGFVTNIGFQIQVIHDGKLYRPVA